MEKNGDIIEESTVIEGLKNDVSPTLHIGKIAEVCTCSSTSFSMLVVVH